MERSGQCTASTRAVVISCLSLPAVMRVRAVVTREQVCKASHPSLTPRPTVGTECEPNGRPSPLTLCCGDPSFEMVVMNPELTDNPYLRLVYYASVEQI
jgi:hypothetical protein